MKCPRQARDQSHQRDRVRWRHVTLLGVYIEFPFELCDPAGMQSTFRAVHTEPMDATDCPARITVGFWANPLLSSVLRHCSTNRSCSPPNRSRHPAVGYEQEFEKEEAHFPLRSAGGELHMRASSSRSFGLLLGELLSVLMRG
jgi:hypothetical protein